MNTSHDELRGLVDGHFGRGLSPVNEALLREHLPVCEDCRAAYEAYQTAERLDPKAVVPRQRLAMALGLAPGAPARSRRRLSWGLATVSVVGAMILLLVVSGRNQMGDGMVSRGKGIEHAESLDVAVFRVKGERESMRVADAVSPTDELAFAYRNELGKAFLMIFAMDGAGHVVWYHPAWTDPADTPRAVHITKQVGFKELPEAVRHPLQGSSLTVQALFMDNALDVRAVEARLARGQFAANASAGEVLRTLVFEVRP